MAVLPDVTVTILDGAIGLTPAVADGVHVVVGVCAAGTPNTIYSFGDIRTLVTTLVGGPAVEAAAHSLAVAGGPVYVMPINASVAGTIGTGGVAHVGTGPSVTASGAPLDAYEPIVKIVAGGAVGTATFQYALDASNPAGPSYGPLLTTAATYVLPGTGITLAFPAGTYVALDTYTVPTVAPGYTSSDVNAAYTALLADPREWGFVHLVGQAASGTASAALASVVAANMTLAETNYRFAFTILEAANDTDANLISAFASFASTRVMVAAGMVELTSSITGRVQARPAAWPIAARGSKATIGQDFGRVASGPVPAVVKLLRDEQATPGLDAQRFATLRTIIGQAGFYITNGNMMAPAGSDFRYAQFRRVMDRACKTARDAIMRYLNAGVRTNADGTIFELDARNIETRVNAAESAALTQPGHATSAQTTVSRTQNVYATSTLPTSVRVLPLGYAKYISLDVGFQSAASKAAAL